MSQPSKCLKFMTFFGRNALSFAIECKHLSDALETLSLSALQKMKEDNISQLGDYDAPCYEQQYMHGLVISLCSNSNHLISLIPPNCLIFRHLLSCCTIGSN